MRTHQFLKLALVVAAASLAACDNTADVDVSAGGTSSGGTSSGGTSSGGTSSGGTSSGGTSSGGTSSGGTSSGGTSSGGTSSGGTSSGGTSSGGTSSGGTSSGGTSSGGTSSGGTAVDPDSRTVGPSAAASGPVDLSTPDAAAKFAPVALQASDSEDTATKAKAAQNCNAGGTQDSQTSGSTTTVTYAQCKTRPGDSSTTLLLQDGVLKTETISAGVSGAQLRLTFGAGGVSYLNEILEPTTDAFRSLQLGVVDSTVSLDSSFAPTRSETLLRLTGAAINTRKASKPRVDFKVGNDSTAYRALIEDMSQRVVKLSFSGPVSASGACGAGSGTVSTPTRIDFDTQTSKYLGGQMMVQNSAGGSATYTFNADGTVTIATAGGSQTYTQAQLQAQCEAFN